MTAGSVLRIAIVQYDAVLKDIEGNKQKIESLLNGYVKGQLDLIVLPEFSLSGYNFECLEDIRPFIEDPQDSETLRWAGQLAIRLQSRVIVGWPCKDPERDYRNALCLLDRDGLVLHIYYKKHLYETDEHCGCSEGSEFSCADVPEIGNMGLAICMDMNPYRFEAPWDAYELAHFHLKQQTRILVCSMAWLQMPASLENQDQPPMSHIQYWVQRVAPLVHENCVLIVCNRVGSERDITYCGNSCVVDLRYPRLEGALNKNEESVLYCEIKL